MVHGWSTGSMKQPIIDTLFPPFLMKSGWILMIGWVTAHSAWSQGPGIERAKAVTEGNWRLEEWQVDGEILRPPQADGRISKHDGVTMVLMHRDSHGTRKSIYSYGTYSFTADTWTVSYERSVIFTDTGSTITTETAPSEGPRTFQMKLEGEKLILDNDNGRRTSTYEGGAWTYFENGKPLRKWRKMPTE
jgi:hypothetical protein